MPKQHSSVRRGTVRSAIAALSLPVAVAVGCGDDPEPEPIPITEAEALALLKALGDVGELIPEDPTNPNFTNDCPDGGTLEYEGRIVPAPPAGFTFNMKMTASMCQFKSGGVSFNIEGGSVDHTGTASLTDTLVSIDLALDGNLQLGWPLLEKEGMCEVDIDVDGSVDPRDPGAPLTGPATGTMCGHEVNVDVSEFD